MDWAGDFKAFMKELLHPFLLAVAQSSAPIFKGLIDKTPINSGIWNRPCNHFSDPSYLYVGLGLYWRIRSLSSLQDCFWNKTNIEKDLFGQVEATIPLSVVSVSCMTIFPIIIHKRCWSLTQGLSCRDGRMRWGIQIRVRGVALPCDVEEREASKNVRLSRFLCTGDNRV